MRAKYSDYVSLGGIPIQTTTDPDWRPCLLSSSLQLGCSTEETLMAILQLAQLSWGLLQKTIPQRQFRNSGIFIKENQVIGVLRV